MTDIYKKKLEEEKIVLENELASLGHLDKKSGDWDATPAPKDTPDPDENDMADRAEDFEERTAILNALELRLTDVNHALEKMENNTYGICDTCGKEIERDRLEANPASHTCKLCM